MMKDVFGTIQRNGRYHLNLRIPVELQHKYGGKEILRRSLRTADPVAAANGVTLAEAKFLKQLDELRSQSAHEVALENLTESQRELFFRAGGLSGLVKAHELSLQSLKFMDAADPNAALGDDDEDIHPQQRRIEIAEHQAANAVLTDNALQEAKTLNALGEAVDILGGGVVGLQELAQAYFEAKGTPTVSQRSYLYPVRRFVELHGDLPLAALTIEHLRIFATEIKKLTPSRLGGVHKLPFYENVRIAKTDKLPLMSEEAQLTAVNNLKVLLSWAPSKGYVSQDVWVSFKVDVTRKKFSQTKRTRQPFSGQQIAKILAYAAQHRHHETIDYAPQ